jgi:hypothetical protein
LTRTSTSRSRLEAAQADPDAAPADRDVGQHGGGEPERDAVDLDQRVGLVRRHQQRADDRDRAGVRAHGAVLDDREALRRHGEPGAVEVGDVRPGRQLERARQHATLDLRAAARSPAAKGDELPGELPSLAVE